MAKRAKNKKKPVNRAKLAAMLVIAVLLVAVTAEVAHTFGSRLPELQRQSESLDDQIRQEQQTNDDLRDDLEHAGDPDFIQDLARNELGLATDGERIFYDVNN